ncbi:MAG: hypothetical protein WDM76_18040 [Limisphaerales bacterium]
MANSIHKASSLSCGQQALWYLNQLEPASTAYHLGIYLELKGSLDEQALALAWADMLRLNGLPNEWFGRQFHEVCVL